MKPFNLERAIAGDPLVTQGGGIVTEFHHLETATNPAVCIAVIAGRIHYFTANGHCVTPHFDYRPDFELFMASKKRTVWVNLYPISTTTPEHAAYTTGGFAYDTEERADQILGEEFRFNSRAYPVEIEE